MASNRFSYDVSDPRLDLDPNFFASDFVPFGGGVATELGNISLMFKALLYESSSCALSAGVGVTLPTAQDVEYLVTTDNGLIFPNGTLANSSILLDVFGSNETVYISPYLAWLSRQPRSKFFHQGFLQVEVAANPSSIAVAGNGLTDFLDAGDPNIVTGTFDWFTPFPSGRTNLFAQTLMRLNLGFGYMVVEDPRADFLRQLTAMLEFHYTTTLQDANISSVPISVNAAGTSGVTPIQTIEFGNLLNRVDIVNMVTGFSGKFWQLGGYQRLYGSHRAKRRRRAIRLRVQPADSAPLLSHCEHLHPLEKLRELFSLGFSHWCSKYSSCLCRGRLADLN